jgi:hypothetical protein
MTITDGTSDQGKVMGVMRPKKDLICDIKKTLRAGDVAQW